jgi:multicomponent Na+:H+ antiporter subunit G
LGAGLLMPEPGWIGRLALLLLVLLLTLPLASHALARAALRQRKEEE